MTCFITSEFIINCNSDIEKVFRELEIVFSFFSLSEHSKLYLCLQLTLLFCCIQCFWWLMFKLQNQCSWEMSFWEIPVGITLITLIEIWRLIHCGCYYSRIEILDFVNEGREVSGLVELYLCVLIGGVMEQTSSYMLLPISFHCHAVAWNCAPNKPVSLEFLTPGKESKFLY